MSNMKRALEREAERRGIDADELAEAIATTPEFLDEIPEPTKPKHSERCDESDGLDFEGCEPCAAAAARAFAEYNAERSAGAPSAEQFAEMMRDAGRGHLLL